MSKDCAVLSPANNRNIRRIIPHASPTLRVPLSHTNMNTETYSPAMNQPPIPGVGKTGFYYRIGRKQMEKNRNI